MTAQTGKTLRPRITALPRPDELPPRLIFHGPNALGVVTALTHEGFVMSQHETNSGVNMNYPRAQHRCAAVALAACACLAPTITLAGHPALPLAVGAVGSLIADWSLTPETNVGLVDYALANAASGKESCVSFSNKFLAASAPASAPAAPASAASGVAPTVVPEPVREGDVYQISLKRMALASENVHGLFLPYLIDRKHQLAVLAKGFEMSPDAASGVGFDFSPAASNSARVIYYSDDIKAGQELNFSQINLLGPARFEGNPVGLSVFVTRIHGNNDKKMSPVLSSLATLGKNTTNPDVMSALDVLGSRILEGQDQRLLRYDAMFLPVTKEGSAMKKVASQLRTAVFSYGDHIVVRKEDRQSPFPWKDYHYDHTTGYLHNGSDCSGPRANVSYAVLQVVPADKVAYAQQAAYSELRKSVADAAAASTPSQAQAFVKGATGRLVQAKLKQQALSLIAEALPSGRKPSIDVRTRLKSQVLAGMARTLSKKPDEVIDPETDYTLDTVDYLLMRLGDEGMENMQRDLFKADAAYQSFEKRWIEPAGAQK